MVQTKTSWQCALIARCFTVILVFLDFSAMADAPQGNSERVDTSFGIPVDRPLLCERTLTVEGQLETRVGEKSHTMKAKSTDELEFVDTHEILTKEHVKAVRHYVKTWTTTNIGIADSPLGGSKVEFREKDGDAEIEVIGDRAFPQRFIDQMLRHQYSASVWIDLPSAAQVGKTYKLDLSWIASVLLSNEGPIEEATAKMKLVSFKAENAVSRFEGSATFSESVEVQGVEVSVRYQLKGHIVASSDEGRVRSLSLEGSFQLKGSSRDLKIEGQGTCEIELTTTIGKSAETRKRRKARQRSNVVHLEPHGVTVRLPSYYAPLEREKEHPNHRAFLRTVDVEDGMPQIDFNLADGPTQIAAGPYFKALEKELKKTDPKTRTENVSSSLRPAKAFTFKTKDDEGGVQIIRAEYLTLRPGTLLVARVVAPPKAFRSALRQFIAARKSIKRSKR